MYRNLFIARKEKRMTQEAAGKLVNMCKQTYYLKENRKRDFTLSEAKLLAKHFNTTVDELFEK
ncbi:helix-turn-helix transcriptional regulator [Bacillus cereus]|uniref:helix-turn-helix transcriptional regulator n=1 Tax=Bacillus cereus TaxID=1396 RepID=UPI000BECB8C0|nr:helix-turn-helix domain-containing protein [Bacillus cereus]PEE35911.1 transcriptional regulator [Bacillus cereus]PET34328.1 transcriptional regulator [Bacillus cereus]PEV75224.1 transcriptional regulator [Bacillus cereus]PFA40879.1 transcriptional regulator [Bacillus cereus]PFD62342.1 transcriptional regulator [Bacillus cereus]